MQTTSSTCGRRIAEAEEAAALGEVPVGAVVVVDGDDRRPRRQPARERRRSRRRTPRSSPSARPRGPSVAGGWSAPPSTSRRSRVRCAPARIVNARVERLVFGCDNPKAGAVRTLYRLLEDPRLNHRVEVEQRRPRRRVRRAPDQVLRSAATKSIRDSLIHWRGGRVWSIAPDSKSGVPARVPGVRIPPSPPSHRSRLARAVQCRDGVIGFSGEMTEWPKVHDWKSCVPKGTEGSNPSLSAKLVVDCG